MRQPFAVPLCYFPSLVLFLDNGHDFLLNVLLQLNEQVAYRWFDVPVDALDFVSHYNQKYDIFSRHCLSEHKDAQQYFYFQIDKDLSPLYAEVYNPYRFSELSVMVVDSEARGMNGFEFCRRVAHTTAKKLLLIHPEQEIQAKEALSLGIIHGYISKKNPALVEKIHHMIHQLQVDYFLSMSGVVARILNVTLSEYLKNSSFGVFMNHLVHKNNIIEYYLIDRAGSFLLLDEDANPSILMVNGLEKIEEYVSFAKENAATDDLIDALAAGKKMPCSFLLPNRTYTWSEWKDTLISSMKIEIGEDLIATYLPVHLLQGLRDRKILSYHRYLNELDAEELSFT